MSTSSLPVILCSKVCPELRYVILQWQLLQGYLPLCLVPLQLIQPRRHMCQSRCAQTCKVDHEAAWSTFKAMLPLVGVDPSARDPGDSGMVARVSVLIFNRFDDFGHGTLLAKPAKSIFGMREWIVDYPCE